MQSALARKTRPMHDLTVDVVEYYLGVWARWMRASHDQRGYGKGRFGMRGATTFDDMCAQVDVSSARATDTAILDLPRIERDAVNHAYLQSFWRVDSGVRFEDAYDRAIKQLSVSMAAKGLQ